MKRHPLSLTTLLLAILVFAGNCRKSELSFEGGSQSQTISFTISGRVLDKNNAPVSQAQVKAGGVVTTTDVNGGFTLDNVRAKKDAAYVTVEKAGYFLGSRTFVAHAQAVNYVSIRLINKEVTGSFAAAGGGQVNLSSGGSINFQPNSIVDAATSSAYTGNVSVAAFFIDPSQQGFNTIMPGDLRGINGSNQERGLESFGMMAVELNSATGQKLQLASGKKATIKFPIPSALLSDAPATIPLWYFDETNGLWKEEGSATKQGNMYVGEVGHFSFWNCDAPFQLVNFEAIVKDQNGSAVVNAEVIIKKVSDGSQGCGRTDDAGRVSGKIPANEPLQIKISDRCNTDLYTQNIGPFSGNANLGTITVNVNPVSTLIISGTAVNCSNAAVTNGYVHVVLDGLGFRSAINNGNFSIAIQRCSNAPAVAEVWVTDLGSNKQSLVTNVNVTSGSVNVGQLTACGTTTTSFVNYALDGTQFAFTVPPDSIRVVVTTGQAMTMIEASTKSQPYEYFQLGFKATTTGTHAVDYFTLYKNGNSYVQGGTMNVNILEFGPAPNGYIEGNFTGNLRDSGSTALHPIQCNFRVKRQ